jgi:hypothetical protein
VCEANSRFALLPMVSIVQHLVYTRIDINYSQIFSGWVEVKATLPTGKLELLTLELHPPTRRWESVNPPAGS